MHLDLLDFCWFFVNIYRGHLSRPLSHLIALEEHQPNWEDYDYNEELRYNLTTGAMSHPTS
jgi:hypothetical protein